MSRTERRGRKRGYEYKGIKVEHEPLESDAYSVFVDSTRRTQDPTPERRLLLATMELALLDLQSLDPDLRARAERYVVSDDRSHVFSFASICDAFDIETREARRHLGKMPKPETWRRNGR